MSIEDLGAGDVSGRRGRARQADGDKRDRHAPDGRSGRAALCRFRWAGCRRVESNDGGLRSAGTVGSASTQALLAWDEATPGLGGRARWAMERAGRGRPAFHRCGIASTTRGGRGWIAWTGARRRSTRIRFRWGPVVRICDERTATVDLRTRRCRCRDGRRRADLRTFLAAEPPARRRDGLNADGEAEVSPARLGGSRRSVHGAHPRRRGRRRRRR